MKILEVFPLSLQEGQAEQTEKQLILLAPSAITGQIPCQNMEKQVSQGSHS